MRESDLVEYLTGKALAPWPGSRAFKVSGKGGDWDRLVMLVVPGVAWPAYGHLELKRPGERVKRADQVERGQELQAVGAYAGWTDSKAGIDAFLLGLQAHARAMWAKESGDA